MGKETYIEKVCFFCEHWKPLANAKVRESILQQETPYSLPGMDGVCFAVSQGEMYMLIRQNLAAVENSFSYQTNSQEACNIYKKQGGVLGFGSKKIKAFVPHPLIKKPEA
jgi:hypothetical protein